MTAEPRDLTERPTALVTGASRGIGRAIARELAHDHDIIAVARSAPDLERLAVEIRAAGGRCEPVVLDVSEGAAVTAALDWRRVDLVVNNAGIGIMRPLIELEPDEWRAMMATNVDALYFVTRALLPWMIERRRGHVIVIGSLAGLGGFAGGTCYSATKHAVLGFAESLMLEVRGDGVKVSVVMPGSVDTLFSRDRRGDAGWKLTAEDIAAAVRHVVDTPPNVLVSRVEMRPLAPPTKAGR